MDTKNKWFAMSRKTDAQGQKSSEAEISIDDNIGGWGITAKDFINDLKALGDVETINLRVQSGGGSIVEGNSIYNALKRHSARIVTHIDSIAASMGSVIAMAGDEVHMAANGLFMIHNPWTSTVGDAEQLRKDAELLDKMGNNIRNSYARSNLSAEELQAAMDASTYYTAKEALEVGFIDSISDANLAAGSIGDMETLKNFENLPQAKIDGIKIECQARQLKAADERITVLNSEIALHNETIALAKNEATEAKAAIETLKTEHSAAIIEAEKVHSQEVSDKAAEMLAESGTPAIEAVIENKNSNELTEEEFWKQYNSLKISRDFEGAQNFYIKNQSILNQ